MSGSDLLGHLRTAALAVAIGVAAFVAWIAGMAAVAGLVMTVHYWFIPAAFLAFGWHVATRLRSSRGDGE